MNDEEEHQKPGDEEVQSTRGLAAAECVDSEGKCGVEGRREGEASPDDEREQNEDDRKVGSALHNVVGVLGSGVGRRAMEVLCEDFAEGSEVSVGSGRDEVFAEVAVEETGEDVDKARKEQQPRGLKVERAAPAVLVGHDVSISGGNGSARCGNGQGEEGANHDVAGLAPVETRVRDDDLEAANEQGEERDDGEPVCHADKRGVTRLDGLQDWGSSRHGRRIAQAGRDCGMVCGERLRPAFGSGAQVQGRMLMPEACSIAVYQASSPEACNAM